MVVLKNSALELARDKKWMEAKITHLNWREYDMDASTNSALELARIRMDASKNSAVE